MTIDARNVERELAGGGGRGKRMMKRRGSGGQKTKLATKSRSKWCVLT